MPAFGQQWKRFRVAWIALLLLTIASNRLGAGAPPQADDATRAALAANALQAWYSGRTGLYNSTGWWNSANAITALADESRVTGSREYWPVFSNTFIAAQKTSAGFLNKFYDDEGWWAMAWIDVYDLTHEARYLAMAQSIFADMAGGWDATCGGGIWWSKDRKYKNAIANELFLDVAAALANRTEGADQRGYAAWARKEWRWFAQSGMINASHTINDGLNSDERGMMPSGRRRSIFFSAGSKVEGLLYRQSGKSRKSFRARLRRSDSRQVLENEPRRRWVRCPCRSCSGRFMCSAPTNGATTLRRMGSMSFQTGVVPKSLRLSRS